MMRFWSSQHSKQSNPEFDNVTHCVRSGYHRVTIMNYLKQTETHSKKCCSLAEKRVCILVYKVPNNIRHTKRENFRCSCCEGYCGTAHL